MQVKDKQYFLNVFNKISESVKTVNDKIIAHQQSNATIEGLLATVALEQLAMQHQILILLATMAFEPTGTETLPEAPKKIMGFMGK
jgi:hypothetical protein